MHVPSTLQLYFQQIRPLALCDAEDGRVVARLLMDLADSKPKDLAHTIRELANRTAMLRECGFRHMGDFLVSMLAASVVPSEHSDSEHAPPSVAQVAAQDPASVTAEQATAIGRMLATKTRSVTAFKLRQAVDLNPVLITMKSRHVWFVPMLEVLLVPREAADSHRSSIARRLTAIVTPHATVDVASISDFDSVVRLL
jgi:hypothetical protein